MTEETHVWHLNIEIGNRKPTPEQIKEHNDECDRTEHVAAAINAVNAILLQEGVNLHQDDGDFDSGYTPSIYANGMPTYIDDETGLFHVPKVPEKWDDKTEFMPNFPTIDQSPIIYTLSAE